MATAPIACKMDERRLHFSAMAFELSTGKKDGFIDFSITCTYVHFRVLTGEELRCVVSELDPFKADFLLDFEAEYDKTRKTAIIRKY